MLKTSRSIFAALRLTLRAQPRSKNFKLRHSPAGIALDVLAA